MKELINSTQNLSLLLLWLFISFCLILWLYRFIHQMLVTRLSQNLAINFRFFR
ncbi:hypothetical protein H1P_1510011 [Hyella patelloides LEGE 07179]|uniref:Uncharacterized protein n=1 Tax=Hyella patelloides LEGE 07179 TaxID=945734 RepID=A0A563VM42_9CYAN|nr:hypothetical protein H1P_1510011 [Hyella patelloides LEGE 07179]